MALESLDGETRPDEARECQVRLVPAVEAQAPRPVQEILGSWLRDLLPSQAGARAPEDGR